MPNLALRKDFIFRLFLCFEIVSLDNVVFVDISLV